MDPIPNGSGIFYSYRHTLVENRGKVCYNKENFFVGEPQRK